MWARIESGSVQEVIYGPKALTIGDIQYPKNIFTLWSQSGLDAIGLYKYVESGRANVSFYNDGNPSFSIDGKVATGTYSPVASNTLINFKALLIEQTRKGVNNLLRENVDDHYAQKYRTGTYEVPDAVSTYATTLTSNWDDYKTAINAVTDIADLENVPMVWPDLP